jgi:hypothetical protein
VLDVPPGPLVPESDGPPGPAGATPAPAGFVTLIERARRSARLAALELMLFEVTGARVKSVTLPAAKVACSGASLAHAWRARQLEELLPVAGGLDPPTAWLSEAASDPALGELAALLAQPEGDLAFLAGLLDGVDEVLLASYRAEIEAARLAPMAEATTLVVLGRVRCDLSRWIDRVRPLCASRTEPERRSLAGADVSSHVAALQSQVMAHLTAPVH